jgi:hypothetical protein
MSIEEQFAAVAGDLVGRDATVGRGQMLHAPGLRIEGGRFFAFATTSDLFVKLPAERVRELIRSGIGRPCEIRRGAPMREWVRLLPPDVPACASFVMEARDFVSSDQGR